MTSIEVKAPPIQIMRLSDIIPGVPIAVLAYGGSGTGKTFFLGTAGSRSLYIDCGIGPLETLKNVTFRKKYPDHNPIVVRVREQFDSDMIPIGTAFDTICDIIDYMLATKADEFDNVLVDNATAIRRFSMAKGIILADQSGKSQTFKGVMSDQLIVTIGKETYKTKRPPAIFPAVQDYGTEMALVEWLCATYIDVFKRAGKNFVLSAHERREYKKVKNAKGQPVIGEPPILTKIRPGFTGQTFPDDIPALFDEVWWFEAVSTGEGTVHRFKAYGDDELVAKTTYGDGILKSVETDPNFQKILARIREGWRR